MAVALDAAGTENTSDAVTTLNNTSLTVGSGSARALLALVSKSLKAKSFSVTWDRGGTNQGMELIVSIDGTGTEARSEIWGLINPTSGNKTLNWVGAASDVCLMPLAYTGVDPTGGVVSFLNSTTAQVTQGASTTQNNGVTVTSTVGNAIVSCQASDGGTYNSTNQTQLYVDSTPATISAAANRAIGAASVSMTANLTTGGAAAHLAIAGCDIAAFLVPTISVQPTNQTAGAGSKARFNVTASGSGTLSYQWTDDGGNVGTNSNTYLTDVLTSADNGAQIKVTVTNGAGSTDSNTVTLTVGTEIRTAF